jgi:hypothetical protein
MTTIGLSPGCKRWTVGDPTKNPPNDRLFLEALVNAGFLAFTHQGGLFGGQSEQRAVVVIHRGHGIKWEVVFQENDSDVVTTTTTDLNRMTNTMLGWLQGGSLAADEDSVHVHAVPG